MAISGEADGEVGEATARVQTPGGHFSSNLDLFLEDLPG